MHETSVAPSHSGHESSVFGTTRIVVFSVALAVLMVLTALVAKVLLGGFRLPQPPSVQPSQAVPAQSPELPQLQSAPAIDLRAYREQKAAVLQGYRWIDQRSGRLQIPIERAMQLIVEHNLQRPNPRVPIKAGP